MAKKSSPFGKILLSGAIAFILVGGAAASMSLVQTNQDTSSRAYQGVIRDPRPPVRYLQCNLSCVTDTDCGAAGVCFVKEPTASCPPGRRCPAVVKTTGVCRSRACVGDAACLCGITSPTPQPSVSPKPGVGACSTVCSSDLDCGTGYCYQPPMPPCPAGMMCTQVMPQAICRSRTCPSRSDCSCAGQVTPTPRPTIMPLTEPPVRAW